LRVNVQAIFLRHVRGDLPHALDQGLKAGGFGTQMQFIAHGNKHAALRIEGYFDYEGFERKYADHYPMVHVL